MSKKTFVLLLSMLILVTLSSVVLVLAGHEDMVRDAFRWAAASIEHAAGVLGFIGVIIVVALVL